MTKQVTRQQYAELLERLGGNEKQIFIGDVLQFLHDLAFSCGIPGKNLYSLELRTHCMELWKQSGLSKSLQQIVEESGFKKNYGGSSYEAMKVDKHYTDISDLYYIETIKSPEANDLVAFLISLFPET